MKTPRRFLFVAFLFLLNPTLAFSAALPPWQFGMTKEQVASFKQFGPYESFSDGDLETYNGIYHGHKENIQFFFRSNRLIRIGVYLGETTDKNKAIAAFRKMYGILERDYGKLKIPEEHEGTKSNPEVRAIFAAMNADLSGQTSAIPVRQPKDVHVVGAIDARNAQGGRWFYITIVFDPR